MIPFLVTERSWRVTEWGGVKFPMRNRPKKAQSVAAQNWRSASLSNRSMSRIWDRCLGINGALGLTVTPLPRFIPRSNELNCHFVLDGVIVSEFLMDYPYDIEILCDRCITLGSGKECSITWQGRCRGGAGGQAELSTEAQECSQVRGVGGFSGFGEDMSTPWSHLCI